MVEAILMGESRLGFGAALRAVRARRCLTVERAAEAIQVTSATWLRWEQEAGAHILRSHRLLLIEHYPELVELVGEWPEPRRWRDDDPRRGRRKGETPGKERA